MIPTANRLQFANAYLELGMLDDAAAELDAICPEDRGSPAVMSLRAKYYLESREWQLMAAAARSAADNDPATAYNWINWAYALRELDAIEQARDVACKALALHPHEAVLHFNMACYCSLLQDLERAATHLRRAVALERSLQDDAATDPDLENLRQSKGFPG